MPGGQHQCGGESRPSSYNPGYVQQPQQPQQPPMHQRHDEDYPSNNIPTTQPFKQEQEKHWYDVDEGTKKKLEVGGGVLAGAAAIGAGILAYKQHNEKKEEKGAQTWAFDTWQLDAQRRTQQFRNGQYPGPVAWILNQGKDMPRDAIQVGEERGERLFTCRTYHEGGLMLGKACCVFKKGAVIGYRRKEIHYDRYEILVGDSRAVKWVPVHGRLNLRNLGARPVEGGREPNTGEPQYICQAPYHGAVHPGKVCESFEDGCFIPYDGTEKEVKVRITNCPRRQVN
ncbi:hypothetical protein J3A83DRAFT_4231840 [Scleroderma citrinum]